MTLKKLKHSEHVLLASPQVFISENNPCHSKGCPSLHEAKDDNYRYTKKYIIA